jgi:hypothetical protein
MAVSMNSQAAVAPVTSPVSAPEAPAQTCELKLAPPVPVVAKPAEAPSQVSSPWQLSRKSAKRYLALFLRRGRTRRLSATAGSQLCVV